MHVKLPSGEGFWRAVFIALMLSALGGMAHLLVQHEGAISGVQAQLEAIQGTLGRLESKMDEVRARR